MNFKWLLATFTIAALAACSGGGSSNSDAPGGGDPITGAASLTITPENAEQASSEVVKALDSAFSASGSALDFGGAIGARVEAETAAAAALALNLAHRGRDSIVASASSVAVGAIITETEECTDSGSTTVSIDSGSLSQVEFTDALQDGSIPPGTEISMSFDACSEPGQPVLNGSITVTFQQFSVEGEVGLDTFTLEFSATFNNLASPDGTINGDISILLVSDAGVTNTRVEGNALEIAVGADSLALFEFLATATQDSVALVQSFDFDLSVSNLGQVTVATLDPWTTNLFATDPISGSLRITGAENTSITITALDEVSVQLDVDSDGDGVANVTIITTWTELESAEA